MPNRWFTKFAVLLPALGALASAAFATVPDLPPIEEVEFAIPAAHAKGSGGSFWTTNLRAAAIGTEDALYRVIAVVNDTQYRDAIAMSEERSVSVDLHQSASRCLLLL